MSNEKRTITLNPELLKITGGTKKRRQPSNKTKIEFKNPSSTKIGERMKTATKRRLLKHLREKQQKEYDKLIEETNAKYGVGIPPSSNFLQNETIHSQIGNHQIEEITTTREPSISTLTITDIETTPNSFKDSVDFLNKISISPNNTTVKQRESFQQFTNKLQGTNIIIPQPEITKNELQTIADFPVHPESTSTYQIHRGNQKIALPLPKYGCLKNGNLPTYRIFMSNNNNNHNYTRNHRTHPFINTTTQSISVPPTQFNHTASHKPMNNITIEPTLKPAESFTTATDSVWTEKDQKIIANQKMKEHVIAKSAPTKQMMKTRQIRKTIRRRFDVGRSKQSNKISVLIGCRKTRNKVTTEKQLLKQVKIDDIKRQLVKGGLIKIGTIAPDDVLRKIHESIVMIGGDVHNYNSENLLYNYINSPA